MDVSPRIFFATHVTLPSSSSPILVMNKFPWSWMTTFDWVMLCFQVTDGFGFPLALQVDVRLCDFSTTTFRGRSTISGVDIDSPFTPDGPGAPGNPIGPGGPTGPIIPLSPFPPFCPGLPIGPAFPMSPFSPRRHKIVMFVKHEIGTLFLLIWWRSISYIRIRNLSLSMCLLNLFCSHVFVAEK